MPELQPILASMAPSRFTRRLFVLLSLMVASLVPAVAQIVTGEGPRYPGTTGDPAPVDTVALKESRERAERTTGLFEGPIDPDRYIIGPGDRLTLSIIASQSRLYPIEVSPDGRLLVPTVGTVDVGGKSLRQTEQAVREAAGRVYRTASIAVALDRVRQFKVHVVGAVITQGTVVATPTTRVSEAIALAGGASSQANRRSITITHRDGGRSVVDLLPFFTMGRRESNPEVRDGDVITVPYQDKSSIVQVFGAVNRPGEMSYHPGDRISALLAYALGPNADAVLDSIEVVSVNERGDIVGRTIHRLLPDGTFTDDRPAQPGDRMFVRGRRDYHQVDRVIIAGQVQYPGSYAIISGETRLRDVLEAAGGFSASASVNGAQLFRQRYRTEVDDRLAAINTIDPEKRTPAQLEYWSQKVRERPGLMKVDFARLMQGDADENIVLMGEDSLFVPEQKNFIRVSGKVKKAGAVTFEPGRGFEDYIEMVGGYGWKADEGAVEIIKAGSGEVFLATNEDDYRLDPGDEIWVPEERPGDLGEVALNLLTIAAQVATIIAVIVSIRQ